MRSPTSRKLPNFRQKLRALTSASKNALRAWFTCIVESNRLVVAKSEESSICRLHLTFLCALGDSNKPGWSC